ncbi:diadenylate cyclase CdaA [Candidatus Galacturonibacter soehngenii]|uniref:Diadenylate cyclase n=1 Tax=Candidatus Galacturonatibacter soehngenii TaxID=2307010 RepID=A0A7V7QHG7_9FIRM|nr:diadenylate cyclase CdaA [Candidatus Galacturonibacter soehngenii]KAB1434385.1 TIGR00159 family protein [Candidatus Galacturonibacter soehngenii]MBA4686728.1 TIGR00159 family protein [Candidatus Galacturonibacter soehngenii]
MSNIENFFESYLFGLSLPDMKVTDLIEIILIAFVIYEIMLWVKNTRAWMLFKGIIFLMVFILFASIFEMNIILWIASKTINVGIIAVIIIFQPELRKALEQLGRKNILTSLFPIDAQRNGDERFSDKTVNEITRAVFEMGSVRTGALIVIERDISLMDYENTGIAVDSIISSQLLINIFEHNTPLHDGAVIVRGNRVAAATCYLPLSDNMGLSKDLGTRHRAGIGISEVSDSMTIIVSEETGKVSIAMGGELTRNVDAEFLRSKLYALQNKSIEGGRFRKTKGRVKNEKKVNS